MGDLLDSDVHLDAMIGSLFEEEICRDRAGVGGMGVVGGLCCTLPLLAPVVVAPQATLPPPPSPPPPPPATLPKPRDHGRDRRHH